ncbi:unnamed protein product [Parnassius mnemosyne]|uniref:Uncharacterized protein n=1 Tax=Parnassius mnemosyne TaxID=213953 RepID=A0AAV1KAN5_9NEOP
MINVFSPENNGWTLVDGKYDFYWFDGNQLPGFVSQSMEQQSVEEPKDSADDQDDDLDIEYQDWLDDELSNFNDDDNED